MRKLKGLLIFFFLCSCGPVLSEKGVLGEYRLVTGTESILLKVERDHRYSEFILSRTGGTQSVSSM